MPLTLDVFIHVDAINRQEWSGAPDERPLTELGREQANALAMSLLADGKIDALFTSPARRCQESLETLAKQTNLPIQVLPGFRDTLGYKAPAGWENANRPGADPLGGANSAGSAYAALGQIQAQVPNGRAVLCSYGDIVPALLAFLAGANGLAMPPKLDAKGAVYRITLDGGKVNLSASEPAAGFPA